MLLTINSYHCFVLLCKSNYVITYIKNIHSVYIQCQHGHLSPIEFAVGSFLRAIRLQLIRSSGKSFSLAHHFHSPSVHTLVFGDVESVALMCLCIHACLCLTAEIML